MEVEQLIKDELTALLEKVGVTGTVVLTQHDDVYNVTLDTNENALIIGKYGNTLASLEAILSLIIAKKTGEFKRIVLEVGEYRKEREEYLKNLALRLKDEVVQSGYEKTVRGLKPWERRLVHMHLQEDNDVTTESMGEGRDRVLVIKKK